MEIKKSVSVKSLIIILILFFILSYLLFYRPYLKKQEVIRKTVAELKAKVYPDLSFSQGVIYTGNDHTWYTLRGVSDGKSITKPIKIKTKDGTLLATSKLAYKIYYLNQNNKLKDVIVVLLAELADKPNHFIAFDSETGVITPEKYQEVSNTLTNLFGIDGKTVGISFFTSIQNIDQQNLIIQKQGRLVIPSFKYIQDFLKQYLFDREDAMNKFTIGNTLDVLLPIGLTSETYNKYLKINQINF